MNKTPNHNIGLSELIHYRKDLRGTGAAGRGRAPAPPGHLYGFGRWRARLFYLATFLKN